MILAIVAVGVASRIPAIFFDGELNPDESQMAAQALRYLHDWVPWRSVDGTTSGPLNSWPLAALMASGLHLNYSGLHLIAAIVLSVLVVSIWATARTMASLAVSLLAVSAGLVWLTLAQGADFVHYSSELIPALLNSAGVGLIAFGLFNPKFRHHSWIASMVILGACPWAKLQSVPIVLSVFCCLAAIVWFDDRSCTVRLRLVEIVRLLGGLASWTALMCAMLLCTGAFRDFWTSYIVRNLGYATDASYRKPGVSKLSASLRILEGSPMAYLIIGTAIFVGAWLLLRMPGWRESRKENRIMFWVCVAQLAGAFAAVLGPTTSFPHYSILLFQPLVLLSVVVLATWRNGSRASGAEDSRGKKAALIYVISMVALPFAFAPQSLRLLENLDARRNSPAVVFQQRLATRIKSLAPDARFLGVWGWNPGLCLLTGVPPASRHATCAYLIEPHPLQDYYRHAFLTDFIESKPEVFVDALAPGCFTWTWTQANRHESFPALKELIDRDYVLKQNLRVIPFLDPVRLYLRRDLALSRPP